MFFLLLISRISGGKGDLVYKTIQDLIKNRFDKFINNLKSKGNENTLRKIQPKIHDKISKYYLDKALKKWKENTYDKTLKHTINLQNFLRHQYAKKMKRDKIRRELLLGQIMDRLTKNNLYKLLLPFNIWHKKTLLDKMNSGATKIQNKWRQVISKQKAKDLNTANKYLNLVKMIKTKNLLDIISKIKKENIKKKKNSIDGNFISMDLEDIITNEGLKELVRILPTKEEDFEKNIILKKEKNLKLYKNDIIPTIEKFINIYNIDINKRKENRQNNYSYDINEEKNEKYLLNNVDKDDIFNYKYNLKNEEDNKSYNDKNCLFIGIKRKKCDKEKIDTININSASCIFNQLANKSKRKKY